MLAPRPNRALSSPREHSSAPDLQSSLEPPLSGLYTHDLRFSKANALLPTVPGAARAFTISKHNCTMTLQSLP